MHLNQIFTSIFEEFSNFSICFWKISFISSIVNKSSFDETSLSVGIVVVFDDDEEQGGGVVKTFEAKIKIYRIEIDRF